MASNDKDDAKKRILVVDKNKKGNNSDPKKSCSKNDDGAKPKSEGESTSNPKDGKTKDTVVVLPDKPTDLAPLGGASLFNSNTEAKNENPEKIVIKTPDTGKNGDEKKKTVVVEDKKPTDIAPLGNVGGVFSSYNAYGNDTSAKKDEQANENIKVETNDSITDNKAKASENITDNKAKASENITDKKAKASENITDNKAKDSTKTSASESKSEEKTDGARSKISNAATAAAGAVTGAAAAGAAAVGLKKKDEPKKSETSSKEPGAAASSTTPGKNGHVSINEERNVNHAIVHNRNAPKRLENVPETSVLNEFRRNSSVVAEGFMYKKRPWLFCFWVQKYFVLLRTGELLFIETDGTGSGSGDWNVKHASALNKIDYEGYSHPSRLAFSTEASTAYFAFDGQEERDYWFEVFQDASRG